MISSIVNSFTTGSSSSGLILNIGKKVAKKVVPEIELLRIDCIPLFGPFHVFFDKADWYRQIQIVAEKKIISPNEKFKATF